MRLAILVQRDFTYMKDKLVGHEDLRKLHPAFRGKYGDKIIDLGIKLSGLNYANQVYDNSKHLTGSAFCKDALDKLGIKRTVVNAEILDKHKNEAFITVSNHPYGHIDGIAVIEAVASRVPQFKMMVNVILGWVDTMAENFIVVNNNGIGGKKSITLNGIKESIDHIKSGHPLGFFPSGAVSNMHLRKGKFEIEDREWQASVIKLIQKAKKTVIPIHISGHNSFSFYATRIFGWKARNLRLCHELYNKNGKEIVLTVGNPILPDELNKFPQPEDLAKYLKAKTYALGKKQIF